MVQKAAFVAPAFNESETAILTFFRRFAAGPNQMLFFNSGFAKTHTRRFLSAMDSLVEKGLVIKEKPREAYSLTPQGYEASRAYQG